MIRCIAIDDEPMALEVLEDYVNRIGFLKLEKTFRDAIDALSFIQANPVDLIFLDINMPEISGLQFLKSLTYARPEIVFCTAYSQYAVESYEYQAIDYLLKPIEFDRFLKAVTRASEIMKLKQCGLQSHLRQNKPQKTSQNDLNSELFLKSGTELRKVKTSCILYIEATGNYMKVVLETGNVLTLMNMNELLQLLPENEFFRVHKSYIVAYHQIDHIERHQLKIQQQTIPIGKMYRNQFIEWLEERQKG